MIALLLLACAGPADKPDTADTAAPLPGDPDYVRDPALDVDLQSEAGSTTSHHTGESCTHCHQAHSDAPGQFTASGSAYTADGAPATTGTIQLWAPVVDGGALLLALPVDALGNFYTTVDLGLPDAPVQPLVLDGSGVAVNQMPWPTESASCNQCHTPGLRVAM